jgi:uncharacterized protein (DUF2147 family)
MTMRTTLLAFTAVLAFMQSASADPTGDWLVADGVAHIRIADCDGRMWGVVSWSQQHGVDQNNPDPAKRSRSTLGMPVILGMQPAQPNRWEGEIYNSENGKTYQGRIILTSPDTLRVEGCVLGFLCGGQNWTRVKGEPQSATPPAARRAGETTGSVRRPVDSRAALREVCSAVGASAGTTGSAHQRRPR